MMDKLKRKAHYCARNLHMTYARQCCCNVAVLKFLLASCHVSICYSLRAVKHVKHKISAFEMGQVRLSRIASVVISIP